MAVSAHFASASRLPDGIVRALYGFSPDLTPFKGKEPAAILAELKRLNCNAVFFSGEKDAELYRYLNDNGIATYHEITIFASTDLYKNRPELRPIRANGSEQPPREWYHGLCPNKAELREKGLERIRALYKRPEVQGVWLDFIRYPVRWELPDPWIDDTCFCDDCLKAYRKHVADQFDYPKFENRTEEASWILREHLPTWIDFKCATIENFVAEAAAIRDEVRPDGILAAFTIPWCLDDFDGAIHRVVGQDFSRLAKHLDLFSPMVYHGLCHKPPEWVGKYTTWQKDLTQIPIWPIVQAMNEPSEMSPEEFERVTTEGGQASGTGVIVFTAGYVDKENRWDQVKHAFSELDTQHDTKK